MADKIAELMKDPKVAKELAALQKSLETPDYEGMRKKVTADARVVTALKNLNEQSASFQDDLYKMIAYDGINPSFAPEITRGNRFISKDALAKAVTPEEAKKEIEKLNKEMAKTEEKFKLWIEEYKKEEKEMHEKFVDGLGGRKRTEDDKLDYKIASVKLDEKQRKKLEPILAERDRINYRIQDIQNHTITPENKAKLIAMDKKNNEVEAKFEQAVTTSLEELGVDTKKDKVVVNLITGAVRSNSTISNTAPQPERKQSREDGSMSR